MILILGASGYMGGALVAECRKRGIDHFCARRSLHNYEHPVGLHNLLCQGPELVINCAAFIPTPSVDYCKDNPEETQFGNVRLPTMLATQCEHFDIPLMHLSTGCLYDEDREYEEGDKPTRDLDGYCGVYLKSKLDAEANVSGWWKHYILRLRLPFDEFYHTRNYLTKLQGLLDVWDHVNSLTHRGDFAKAALDLWNLKAPWGTYHVVNPGFISASKVVQRMAGYGLIEYPKHKIQKGSGCTLSTKKLLEAGVKIRDVHDALHDALKNWSCIFPTHPVGLAATPR